MKTDTYFVKYNEIYGIEQPAMFCGYATKCIRFTDLEKAKAWVNEATGTYRFLGTKSDAQHSNIKGEANEQ